MLTQKQLGALRRFTPDGRNRLSKAIELMETTQVKVAEAVGMTQPHISAIALGRYGEPGLPVETARKLAEFFGCAIEDLFPARQEVA